MTRTVLIVDDDAAILNFLADYCAESGFAVLRASDGQEGLELARQHRPTLIITDLMMPLMDGATLIAALRQEPTLRHATTVLLSAASRVQLQNVAADIVVPKPFDLDEIDRVLQRIELQPEHQDRHHGHHTIDDETDTWRDLNALSTT